jgi:hypothetical protein
MMKKLLISTFLGMLAFGASAQTEQDQSIRITGHQIQLPEHRYPMFEGDFRPYQGWYDLSNGQTMRLRGYGNRIFVELDDGPRTQLVAASANTFVAVDRSLKMTLKHGDFDDVTGEVLMAVPTQAAQADGSHIQMVRLVASR